MQQINLSCPLLIFIVLFYHAQHKKGWKLSRTFRISQHKLTDVLLAILEKFITILSLNYHHITIEKLTMMTNIWVALSVAQNGNNNNRTYKMKSFWIKLDSKCNHIITIIIPQLSSLISIIWVFERDIKALEKRWKSHFLSFFWVLSSER